MEMKIYETWLRNLEDNQEDKQELLSIKDNKEEIVDRFYQKLKFGTAGLRGIMGLGTNRMNTYTVGVTTKGLANYINTQGKNKTVVIGYDSRNNSEAFAKLTASILSSNNISVFIYNSIAPTPLVAYATIKTKSTYGIMITASHNPKEYNGYKVFNHLGCQIDNKEALLIEQHINDLDIFNDVEKTNFEDEINNTIKYIDNELIDNYFKDIMINSINSDLIEKANLNIVYTPLNGTGNKYVRKVLEKLKVSNVHIVKEQELPDGDFPTCPYPNPEFKEALELGLKLSAEANADALLATDPDADRFAVAVKHNSEYKIINGNELGILLLNYIASERIKNKTMPINPVAVRSIVSSKLYDKIAESYGVEVIDVLTGFKYIGEIIEKLNLENNNDSFIFGFEESCGYLIGTHVRDKDAVVTSLVVTEMLAKYKLENKTLVDVLDDIYKQYGYYSYMTENIMFEGIAGQEKMTNIMSKLRTNPLKDILGRKVVGYVDYLTQINISNNKETGTNKDSSNVLEYILEDGNNFAIRPSGTEPKLKIYYNISSDTKLKLSVLEKEYKQIKNILIGKDL